MKDVSKMSFKERLCHLLDGIDVNKLSDGNQLEALRFYEKNTSFLKGMSMRFCQKELNENYSCFEDLMQEAFLHISEYDYTDYSTLCKSIRRVFFLSTMPEYGERTYIRLDAPVNTESKSPLAEIAEILKSTEKTSVSDKNTLLRLINWLRSNLSKKDFQYVYLRYITLASTQTIYRKLGYSPLCGDDFITRLDRNVMLSLREKHIPLCEAVGGIFENFKNSLPSAVEKRKNIMTAFSLSNSRKTTK